MLAMGDNPVLLGNPHHHHHQNPPPMVAAQPPQHLIAQLLQPKAMEVQNNPMAMMVAQLQAQLHHQQQQNNQNGEGEGEEEEGKEVRTVIRRVGSVIGGGQGEEEGRQRDG